MSLPEREELLAPLAVFTVALLARLLYWVHRGTAIGNDTDAYTRVCDLWAADPTAALTAKKGLLYSGFTLPLCGVLSIPGASFDTWVGVQILLSALGCVLLYRIGTDLVDARAGLLAGLALAVLWDTYLWDVFVLSDSLFTVGVIVTLWTLSWHHRDRTRRSRVAVVTAMGYLLLSRPHGFPLVAGWVLYDLFPRGDRRRLGLFSQRLVPAIAGIATVGAVPYAIRRYSLFELWQRGELIYNDAPYVYPFVSDAAGGTVEFVLGNSHHLAAMGLLKAALFYVPFVPRHSIDHIGINLVTYLPILLIGAAGLRRAWRTDLHLFRMWATPVLVMTAITAVTIVSYDFRYRAPLGPVFALAFGYKVSSCLDAAPQSVTAAVDRLAGTD